MEDLYQVLAEGLFKQPTGVFMKSNFLKLGFPLLVIMSTVNWFMEVFTGGVTWLLA